MGITSNPVADQLVARGQALFTAPKRSVQFTGNADANNLLNDLADCPHAFVLACIADRQVKAERAWLVPYNLSERHGDFKLSSLAKLSLREIKRLMSEPYPLHRFLETVSVAFHAGIRRIAEQYNGDAARIWADTPPSAEVVYRFLQFQGIGPKIATMAANILGRVDKGILRQAAL